MSTTLPAYPLPTTPCTEGACLHADPTRPCTCTACGGTGHGHIQATAHEQGRAAGAARTARDGGIWASLALTDGRVLADQPLTIGGRGLAAIRFDADGWPID